MNKTDLINAIAEKAELTKADAGRALEAFFETVQKSLKAGEDVSVVGFGTFTVRKRAARTGRNPPCSDRQTSQHSPQCLPGGHLRHVITKKGRCLSGERMARVTGLEPATSGVTGRHSNRLSYTRALDLSDREDITKPDRQRQFDACLKWRE